MKLMNAVSLQRLAKDPSYPTQIEGPLNFRRSGEEKFQKRYFILKGNLLFYFWKKSDRAPVGLIILEGYTVELSNEQDGYCFQVVRRSNGVDGTSDTIFAAHTFVVDNSENLQNWLSALTTCGYGQLKISTETLEERYAEMNLSSSTATTTDENANRLRENSSSDEHNAKPTSTFAELHENYGNRIRQILAATTSENAENNTGKFDS